MAKADKPDSTAAAPAAEPAGVAIVAVIFSEHRATYQIAPAKFWLSVEKFSGPAPEITPHGVFLGFLGCPGGGWRKAYALDWSALRPAETANLPADDLLVTDYLALAQSPSRENS
jgi:hypothetical protein